VHEIGIEDPSPMVMVEKGEEEQADIKSIFEVICEEALESKIQSVPLWLLSVKLFMKVMKAAWSQLGGAIDRAGDTGMY
jgi:hypothetical protein